MLYAFSHNSSYEPQWASSSYKPVDDPGRVACTTCEHRGQKQPVGPIELVLDPGTGYPDILSCLRDLPLLVVSQRVVQVWWEAGIQGFEAFPATVIQVRGFSADRTIPDYFYVRVTGRGQLDEALTPIKRCPACGDVLFDPTLKNAGYVLKEGSWNGFDLFATDEFPQVTLCTERILKLAGQHRFTNSRFTPAAEAGPFGSLEYINYLNSQE